MCGICGLVGFNGKKQDYLKILKMNSTLKHRGPDDEGYLSFDLDKNQTEIYFGNDTPQETIGRDFLYSPSKSLVQGKENLPNPILLFGHRRLSIIDLSPLGHQPMCNENGTIWLIFNGEIYNYIELKAELLEKGHTFVSKTDAETIVHSYEEWGERCVEKFNGMWAFAILDLKKKAIFCSRDRSGVKPFYYFNDKKEFVFASEIRALKAIRDFNHNEKIVWDYLVLRKTNHTEETFYKEIYELPPAHNIIVNFDGILTIRKYWECDYFGKQEEKIVSINEEANEISKLIEESIRIRLRSDVAIGSCLSGGLDSSTIVANVNRILSDGNQHQNFQLKNLQKTFTAAYNNKKYDESRFVEILKSKYQFDSKFVYPQKEEFLDDVGKLIQVQEEPFSSTSVYAQYRVMKLARENGITVLLDGQGADELFGGYLNYFNNYLIQSISKFKPQIFSKEIYYAISKRGVSPLSIFKGLLKEPIKAFFLNDTVNIRKRIFKEPRFIKKDFFNDYRKEVYTEAQELKKTLFSLNKKLQSDFCGGQLRALLRYEDKNSMAFSIESRTPFADDINLIDRVVSLPSYCKISCGWQKFILRKASEKLLPKEICWRKDKMGFETPEREWIQYFLQQNASAIYDLKSKFLDTEKIKKENSLINWKHINILFWENIS
ncbi:MAG: asparagine synthase (glutamine-hydrolyzing) [Thermoanaerobaculaceae bacterium]|nr:asparagine synthase (glutamine-hydrolyzing) [Thermoanaerobaculaceae bacterium]